jgi:two-component system response regulator MprA
MANILIVDDDLDIVDTFADILRSLGHTVRTATNGEEGLRVLRSAALPDVVLLDCDMPVMTGPEMAHQMLVHDLGEENIPVVLVSARPDLREIAGRLATRYFVAKTGHIDDFLRVVNRALRERVAPL